MIIIVSLSAQDFAPIGATWWYGKAGVFHPFVGYIKIESVKDTLINNQMCRKLDKEGDINCLYRPFDEFVYSKNDSVFFYDFELDTFQLMYDFNASIGDEWTMVFPFWGGIDTVVAEVLNIDEYIINGMNLNSLKIRYTNFCADQSNTYVFDETAIEGVGSLTYLFTQFWPINNNPIDCWICDGDIPTGIRCLSHPDIGEFHFPNQLPCESVTAIEEISQNDHFNLILSDQELILQTDQADLDDLQLRVVNVQGQQVIQDVLTQSENRVDISLLPPGIYVVIITNSNGYIAQQKVFID